MQKEFLSVVANNVQRLSALINDVLDVDKIESGRFQTRNEPQDLGEILRECHENFLLIAHQKGLELKLNLPPELRLILGDRGRLIQIFTNLLSNAVKYTRSGFIEVSALTFEEAVTVRVQDTGIGFSTDEKARLFEKFYRTESGIASGEKGTGLGLAITRGLVEAHEGRIEVQSEAGKGTCFEVTFPYAGPVVQVGSGTRESSDELLQAIRTVDEIRRQRQSGEKGEDIPS
jgi:signal transduction histidine kinase